MRRTFRTAYLRHVVVVVLCAPTSSRPRSTINSLRSAVEIAHPFGFPVTNSMVVTWIVTIGLIVFAQLATRNMKQVPDGAQNFLEWLVGKPVWFLEGLLGAQLAKRPSGSSARVFIFILASNWLGARPGCRLDGMGALHGRRVSARRTVLSRRQRRRQPDARHGPRVLRLLDRLGPASPRAHGLLQGDVCAQGIDDGSTEGAHGGRLLCCRPPRGHLDSVSPGLLSFRLYGNIFAGETMLETMAQVPYIAWLVQIPFYFLELLVGLVQALVFMLLTAVFTLLICQHHEEGSAAHH